MSKINKVFIKIIFKIINKFKNIYNTLYELGAVENYKKNCCISDNTKIYKSARLINVDNCRFNLIIGSGSIIRGEMIAHAGGKIIVGDSCYLGDNSKIWSTCEVKVGNNVLISHNVNIHDNNSHSLDSKVRKKELQHILQYGHSKENIFNILMDKVNIEDDVWIGFNSTILKGVTIGKGSIIGANSIVTKSIPPYSLVIGNPAKVIRKLR